MCPGSAIQRIIEAAHPPPERHLINASRRRILELTCEAADLKYCAAFIWLYDAEREVLDLGHQFATTCKDEARPEALARRLATPRAPGLPGGLPTEPEHWRISLEEQPEISEWCREQGIFGHEYAFPIEGSSGEVADKELIGILQIVSADPGSDEVNRFMPLAASALGLMIARCREQRRLRALQRIQTGVDLTKPIDACFALAAETLREATGAELCAVYRQKRDLGLSCVASSPPALAEQGAVAAPDSLTSAMLRWTKPARISDFQDKTERQRLLHTQDYDERLYEQVCRHLPSGKVHALMFAPVGTGDEAVAVVHLLNKTQYLARKFSITERNLLIDVCAFLSRMVPAVETRRVMERITATVFSGGLKSSRVREALFDLLADMIPGVVTAALITHSPDAGSYDLLHLGGEIWFDHPDAIRITHDVTLMKDKPKVPVADNTGADPDEYVTEITGLERKRAWLAIGLRRSTISAHEKRILSFACKELSQVLRGEELQEVTLQDINQIRHVIRSGLTGVIGHLDEARGCYKICQARDFDPSIIKQARFNKALQRAHEFGRRTQVLMEQSRFLLGTITRASLRLGSHSLSTLAREVVECLQPAAGRRGLEILLANRVPRDLDDVQMDRELVYILMFNLVDNAVKYSHRDRTAEVELYIDRNDWLLSVVDEGVYIEEEDYVAIFEPFIRKATGPTGRMRRGTGLGLATVREIVHAHGGGVTVASKLVHKPPEELAETEFVVRMPRRVPKAR